ncbi:MAG TPA: hypothetical protein VGX69_02895 [Solirubrobacteraceae bacterium]|jgi:hypothetical protein|nr:hypothetical protein [Solirubrobacteraceae bacterium]
MRSTRFALLLTAAVSALAIAPAGVQARPNRVPRVHRHATRPCRIKLEVTKTIVTGEKVTLTGLMICPNPEEASGKTVTLYQRSEPKAGFVAIESVKTETDGAFEATPPLFETNSVFYATSEGAQSSRRTVRVATQVTPEPPTPAEGAHLFTRGRGRGANTVIFAGTVNKADVGAHLALQREEATQNEEWRAIQFGTVGPGGKYVIEHNFALPGDANIRVVVHPNPINAPAASAPMSYEISQTENPALTLESELNPLAFGQSTKLKGVVAGAPTGTLVTLLAHGKKAPFAPVATTHTGSGGSYEFPQAPQASTYYRATTAAAHSAVLFEGVKYILTEAAPTGTPAVGQPMAFSGTVLPALSGHVVYLERQGKPGLGWNVIDVGTVGIPAKTGEAAPFSIIHTFNAHGPYRLRLAIPGDPVNQGAAGTPFELNIAPALASAIPPAPAARLPVEGQL